MPEQSAYYLQSLFRSAPFPARAGHVVVNVKSQDPCGKYRVDIQSDLGDLSDRLALFEQNAAGTQVFLQVDDLKLYAPVGVIAEQYIDPSNTRTTDNGVTTH